MKGYSNRREAATLRTKYAVGDRVVAFDTCPTGVRGAAFRKGAAGRVERVERGVGISSTGILLSVRRPGGRLITADAYWWRKVTR